MKDKHIVKIVNVLSKHNSNLTKFDLSKAKYCWLVYNNKTELGIYLRKTYSCSETEQVIITACLADH